VLHQELKRRQALGPPLSVGSQDQAAATSAEAQNPGRCRRLSRLCGTEHADLRHEQKGCGAASRTRLSIGVAKRQITIRIKGSPEIGGFPRLSDFLKQLDAIKVALKHTERLHAHSDNAVDYRIVSLSMASPATVVLEEIPKSEFGKLPEIAITDKLISTLSQIESGRKIPHQMRDLAALEAYRRTAEPVPYDPRNPVEITRDTWFAVHPMFAPALGLVVA